MFNLSSITKSYSFPHSNNENCKYCADDQFQHSKLFLRHQFLLPTPL